MDLYKKKVYSIAIYNSTVNVVLQFSLPTSIFGGALPEHKNLFQVTKKNTMLELQQERKPKDICAIFKVLKCQDNAQWHSSLHRMKDFL